jgi:hypothetical protein
MANMITQNYMEALGKQIFSRDFIINGLFPCQSSFTKMINLARVDWKFNDKFEYRMLMANTNSGGTVNTQTFDENFQLMHPGELEYGVFRATYGAIMDGFTIDMTKQLETKESRAAFNREYAMRLHSMRINVASLFKNIMIHGRYMVAHKVAPPLNVGTGGLNSTNARLKYQMQWRPGGIDDVANWQPVPIAAGGLGYALPTAFVRGCHIRMQTPRNVFNTNFKQGRLLTIAGRERKKVFDGSPLTGAGANELANATRLAPWGQSFVGDMWVVYDNQATMLELVYIGPNNCCGLANRSIPFGSYFQVAGNRKVPNSNRASKTGWHSWTIEHNRDTSSGFDKSDYVVGKSPDFGVSDPGNTVADWRWAQNHADGTGSNTMEYSEATGAMEGTADMFPWYTAYGSYDPNQIITRMGINRPFRGQANRLRYTSEQAGQIIIQQPGQTIMNAIMTGVDIATSVCDWEDLVVFINPSTLTAIGMYEGLNGVNNQGLQVFKESNIDTKLIYQRGITGISFRIGDKIIPNVVKDWNFPTDIVLLAPMKDLQYNCWDNAAWELNTYIQDTFSGKAPPPPKDVAVPKEFLTRMDISSRIVYGAPVAQDLTNQGLGFDNGFIHPSNSMPVAYQEMGALFTENPYAYTIVKLANQIINVEDTIEDNWAIDINRDSAA